MCSAGHGAEYADSVSEVKAGKVGHLAVLPAALRRNTHLLSSFLRHFFQVGGSVPQVL